MPSFKSILFFVAMLTIIVSCTNSSPSKYDLDGVIYFQGNGRAHGDKIPVRSLAFQENGTVVHSYIATIADYSDPDKYTDPDNYQALQTLGKYTISGKKIIFTDWCNITNPELATKFNTESQELPDTLLLEIKDGRVDGLRPLSWEEDGEKRERYLYTDNYDWWSKQMQETASKRFSVGAGRYVYPLTDSTFPQKYVPPAHYECRTFEDEGSLRRAKEAAKEAKAASLPDPSGSYSDREGGLSFTFLSTGKFWQELLGETTFGTWERSGGEVSVSFSDGSTMYIELGDGYVVYNGMRLDRK